MTFQWGTTGMVMVQSKVDLLPFLTYLTRLDPLEERPRLPLGVAQKPRPGPYSLNINVVLFVRELVALRIAAWQTMFHHP